MPIHETFESDMYTMSEVNRVRRGESATIATPCAVFRRVKLAITHTS